MAKKYLYGVKYLIPYDMVTMEPKGIFEVLGSVGVGREIEQLPLSGGHNDGPYAIEAGEPANSLTATIREYPNFAYSLFENAELTTTESPAAGTITAIANTSGTSVFEAALGIASVAITAGKDSELPFGDIIVIAKTATTVDLAIVGDVASGRIPIVSELPVIASDITIVDTGATVDVAGYGITITSGSGVIAMTPGDVATFNTARPNTTMTKILVGKDASVNYFGVLLVWPKNAEKEQVFVNFPRVAAVGMSFDGNTREFSEFEQAMTPLLSDASDYLYELIRIKDA